MLTVTKSNHFRYFWYNEIHPSFKKIFGLPMRRMFTALNLQDFNLIICRQHSLLTYITEQLCNHHCSAKSHMI